MEGFLKLSIAPRYFQGQKLFMYRHVTLFYTIFKEIIKSNFLHNLQTFSPRTFLQQGILLLFYLVTLLLNKKLLFSELLW